MDAYRETVRLLQTAPVTRQAEPIREHMGKKPGAFEGFEGNFSKAAFAEKPRPLPGLLAPVPAFNLALLPEVLRDYVRDVSERMQMPFDFVAVLAVVCLGAVIGRRLGIHPKQFDNWLVVPNVWGGIVGDSAQMKTPVFNEVLGFLYRLEAEARTDHAAADTSKTEQLLYEAQLAALKENLKLAAKNSRIDEMQDIQQQLSALTKPDATEPARYVVNDSTVEKIGELLNRNPAGLLLYRDELKGFLLSMNRQGREGDRQFYLEAWGGSGRFNVDRIGRGSIHIDALCVSVLGGIQPGPLREYTAQALQNSTDADGFMQRFQLLVWPDTDRGWLLVDRVPDQGARDAVWRVFQSIASMPAGEAVPAIRFDNEAQGLFNVWLHQHENELRSGEHPAFFVSHLAKYRSLMPSLALICHCIEHAEHPALIDSAVNVAAAERAVAWCDYLKAHALRVYGSTAPRPEVEAAQALAQKIKAREIKDGMTVREIKQKDWAKLSESEHVKAGLNMLQDHGWLIIEKSETGGRPSELVRLHSDFHPQNLQKVC
jgi:hypothetical protein